MSDPYRRIARFYDAVVEPFNATLRSYVVKVARPTEGTKVLEIGCGTGTNLELFADGSFDLVLSFLTLHEMPTDIRSPVLQEMVRVAGPAGKVLLIDYHPGPLHIPKGWFYKSVIYAIEFGAGWEHFQNHRDFLARKGLPALMTDNGLSVTKERILAGGNIHVVLANSRA